MQSPAHRAKDSAKRQKSMDKPMKQAHKQMDRKGGMGTKPMQEAASK